MSKELVQTTICTQISRRQVQIALSVTHNVTIVQCFTFASECTILPLPVNGALHDAIAIHVAGIVQHLAARTARDVEAVPVHGIGRSGPGGEHRGWYDGRWVGHTAVNNWNGQMGVWL